MSRPLHLLRPFTGWFRGAAPISTVAQAEEYVRELAEEGWDRFYTWSSRWPKRSAELKGGSVYFVSRKVTLFRMPFREVEDSGGGAAICMRPELVRVQGKRVGLVRGWRYLADVDAPHDLPAASAAAMDELPDRLRRELEELGL